MNTHLLALYVLAVFLAMIAPGPDMMFVLAVGARGGPRAGLLATLGVASSEIVQITAVAAGLSALLLAAPAAFTVLRLCGAAYLLYLGVQALRSALRGSPVAAETAGARLSGGDLHRFRGAYRRGGGPHRRPARHLAVAPAAGAAGRGRRFGHDHGGAGRPPGP